MWPRVLFVLAFLLGTAAPVRAQSVVGNPLGADMFPMVMIDGYRINLQEYPTITFPEEPWQEAKACLVAQGVAVPPDAAKPALRVVPLAHTIQISDPTLDSLIGLTDTTRVLGRFQGPTPAYTLVRENTVLVVSGWTGNRGLLRHEALHSLLWQSGSPEDRRASYGHPARYFQPCDWALSNK